MAPFTLTNLAHLKLAPWPSNTGNVILYPEVVAAVECI